MGIRPRTSTLPPSRMAYVYVGALVLVFAQAGLYAARVNTRAAGAVATPATAAAHPIAQLMADAEARFRATLAGQSTTLRDAVREYQRRYGRNPPKGFDAWWTFAEMHNVRLVDEFDTVHEDLEPFWDMSGEEFRERAKEASVYPAIDVIRIRGGQATADHPRDDGEGTSGRAAGFIAMLQPFVQLLPDMDLALNTRVEPRIIVPWTGSNTTEPLTHDPAQYVPDWQGQGSTWDAYRRHCPPRTSARALYRSLRPARGGSRGSLLSDSAGPVPGPFAENTIARTDFCAVPSAHTLHGLFFCDWRAVPARLPILSAARAPGFGDVRVPSHYYYWPSRRHTYGFDPVNLVVREQDAREVPWAAKHDKIWWRGPSTGGGGSPPGYAERYQRHRLLALAAENGTAPRTVTFPDPVAPRRMRQARVPVGALNADTFDLAFTRVAGEGNWPGGAAGLREDFAFEEDGTALGARWASKYALDIDGVGHSGVFLALMESDSAVLKAGVFAEFWEHWAVPWLHYVPLSAGYAELYDLHAYFSGPGPATRAAAGIPLNATSSDEGDRRLRRIARAGKQWRRTIARSVDMEAYVFRLMLEYARLWADDRESMDFVL